MKRLVLAMILLVGLPSCTPMMVAVGGIAAAGYHTGKGCFTMPGQPCHGQQLYLLEECPSMREILGEDVSRDGEDLVLNGAG